MSKYEGVLDRIEDGQAVILVEDDKRIFFCLLTVYRTQFKPVVRLK